MRIINIPPYKGPNYTPEAGHYLVREVLAMMAKKGQLQGIEVDIDEGYPVDPDKPTETRDDEVLAMITPGLLSRVRHYSEMGKYDAIVTSGSIEPGFFAAREISKIPIACAIHAAVHAASLIGDRFSIIELTDPMAKIVRRFVDSYGFGHKLASVRTLGRSSTFMMGIVRKVKKEDRLKIPEARKHIDHIGELCTEAIEKDRADCLILGCPPLQCLEDEIRVILDEKGYEEIQLISEIPAAVEVAKLMVNMKLIQSPRAYPGEDLKAKPEFR
jgi:allantoin racemase